MKTQKFKIIALLLMGLTTVLGSDYIWIESENPTQNPMNAKPAASERKQHLSEGKWISLEIPAAEVSKKLPPEGALIGYDFEVKKAGKYAVWNRIGMNSIRSVFDWKIDNNEWKSIPLDAKYTDLMDLAVWNEISWVQMGEAELQPGKHNLQIRVMPSFSEPTKDKNGKIITEKKPLVLTYYSDCFCISLDEFRPNGKHKPDSQWMTEDDKKASTQVFEVKADNKNGERAIVSLEGLWQVARYDEFEPADRSGPDKVLPDPGKMIWSAIPIPSDTCKSRPDLTFAHRLVYRTRIQVPPEMKDRSFVLRFPYNNMISSVFVNGKFCGWTKAMLALWDCDVTSAIKPGDTNEISVVIKDTYYALSPKKDKRPFYQLAYTPLSFLFKSFMGPSMDFPVHLSYAAGILEKPSLLVGGNVYVADLFAKPSVKKKELALEITLKNPGPTPLSGKLEISIEPFKGVPAEKTFVSKDVTVGAGEESVVNLAEAWENPKLWWPDDPQQYFAVSKVSVGGKIVDVQKTKFGFREWDWSSTQFKLNGIPWHGRADGTAKKTMDDCLKLWHEHGQNMVRVWGQYMGAIGLTHAEALDRYDQEGIVVRLSDIFDGSGANYGGDLNDPILFDNWVTHLEQWIKTHRNHPSILIWSIENEITFINSRNLGLGKLVEPMIAKAGKRVMELDPTRPAMVDGGRCLLNEEMPVNGCHYDEAYFREYPDEAYTYALAEKSHQVLWTTWFGGKSPWRLVPDRPIFHGEGFWLRAFTPATFSQFAGEGCFQGWEGSRPGAGLYAKMLSEGYRWHGVAAFHFWLAENDVTPYYNSWKPVIVLCREWNWTFGSGTTIERTLKILNDTRHSDPIEMGWEFRVGGKSIAGEKKSYTVAPGMDQEIKINFKIPVVKSRTPAEFVLTCHRGGAEVFRDVKPVWLIDAESTPKPSLKSDELVVIDPNGAVKTRLQQRGIPFSEIKKEDAIPAKTQVLIVGPDAIDAGAATDTKWKALAAHGGRVLVLDQSNPLRNIALTADLEPTSFVGRVALSENLQHPVFQGLDQPDFFTWSKDHIVYRNVYQKASRGARSLAYCDQELGYTCLSECEINDGLMVLCQMLVGTKLGSDPVAQQLFDNLLNYCANYKPLRRTTVVAVDDKSKRMKLLNEIGLNFTNTANPMTAIQEGKAEIIVTDASPATLKELAGKDSVKQFTQKGGWLFLWGLTPEGLADFNRLVGVDHVIRPFECERVTMAPLRDPLGLGMTDRDIAMESGEAIFSFNGTKYVITDEFNYIVDLDDIAPFCEFPNAKAGDIATARKVDASWPRNVVNGFTGVDAWKLIYYMQTSNPKLSMKLPKTEEILGLDIVLNKDYSVASRLKLFFDNDTTPVLLTVEPNNQKQVLQINPPRKANALTIELADWDKTGPTTGIDNLWLRVKRTDEFHAKVKPLLNIGGLVKYPQGKGGIILCQLVIPDAEVLPENAKKRKNIVTTLLRNLGGIFSGGKIVVAGSGLACSPVPLEEPCNIFLTSSRGWFKDEKQDLGHFPVGEQVFAGVKYSVRDFKTSPLPCAISLAGPQHKEQLPETVTNIPVKQKTEALFFLHTAMITGKWEIPKRGDKTPPVVWKYIVKYADGQTLEVPVRYTEGVSHWLQKEPADLSNAVVAWSAPFPGNPSGYKPVVYQMQWTNPKPDLEIATIDIAYDANEKIRLGMPIILGITGAKEAK